MNESRPAPVNLNVSDARILVIGASSGIGLAAAAMAYRAGASVVGVARGEASLKRSFTTIGGPDAARLVPIAADARDPAGLESIFTHAGPVDHVLLTAGFAATGPARTTPWPALESAYRDRLATAYAVAQRAAPTLAAGGSLVFTSGGFAIRPAADTSVVAAGLAALETFVRGLALELAPRNRVNAIRPGRIDTPMLRGALARTAGGPVDDESVAAAGRSIPLGRIGDAREAAHAALFLMANSYITGVTLGVDGGQGLR
ncbi:SDR family oxidoreductase [Rhodococcus sp. UNC363MFTsu5.1]|uniref:SDR family oxidoreductase n=1 Tax=Rhodococcus sp. UNC363MFTsu5.1 TaxID=1449069 RepID=UPI0006920DDC|nr:SDR family oxidoreductase [Rhodococcus sp. UNC363MFTsu5.1]